MNDYNNKKYDETWYATTFKRSPYRKANNSWISQAVYSKEDLIVKISPLIEEVSKLIATI